MKKTQMVMIRAPELPLHTSGHSGKCRCHKKRGAPGAPGEDAREPTPPPSPPSRIEQSPRKSKMLRVRGKGGGEMRAAFGGNKDILEVGELRRRQGLWVGWDIFGFCKEGCVFLSGAKA